MTQSLFKADMRHARYRLPAREVVCTGFICLKQKNEN
jgi:hypothetical protein